MGQRGGQALRSKALLALGGLLGAGAAATIAAGAIGAPARDSAATPVTVSPLNGTPDASPQTQISILGPAPQDIGAVTVVGSGTGSHSGHLAAYSGNRGASFIPDKPFRQGERVTVSLQPSGSGPIKVSFTIARLGAVAPPPAVATKPHFDPTVLQHFRSDPNLLPPQIKVLHAGPRGSHIFLAAVPAPPLRPDQRPNPHAASKILGPAGRMILDAKGNLVWFAPLRPPPAGHAPVLAFDLQPATYDGQPVLTWWQGPLNPLGFGQGEDVIANSSYRPIVTLTRANGYQPDLHELQITPQGDALVSVYSPIHLDLSPVHGPSKAVVLDAIFQEIDIKTGLVVYEWHMLGHVPLTDSYVTPVATGYDPWHLNSMQQLANGNFVVSDRNTWGIYEIDRASGRVLWALGGKHPSFRMGPGAKFAFQHDARLLPSGLISLFDDGAGPPVFEPRSRGLLLRLDAAHRTATVVRSFYRGNTLAGTQGNMQPLPDGSFFVGWGSEPFFSSFTRNGKLSFDASFPTGDESYRALTGTWVGTPTTPPLVAAGPTAHRAATLYVSWNGATQVASWRVLGGAAPGSLAPVGSPVARSGFETAMRVAGPPAYVAVQALDASGSVLGTSATIKG